jgi:hypothetical protein
VCLGAYAGLRVSEAAALDWPDVDVEAKRARILGKGQKTRLVALSPLLIDQLLPDTGGNVVAGAEHKPYSAAQLQRRVNRAIKAAGVDATFHQLRHRYGTIAYQATGDLLAVGRQMGHASPVTTAVYAAASDEVADQIAGGRRRHCAPDRVDRHLRVPRRRLRLRMPEQLLDRAQVPSRGRRRPSRTGAAACGTSSPPEAAGRRASRRAPASGARPRERRGEHPPGRVRERISGAAPGSGTSRSWPPFPTTRSE